VCYMKCPKCGEEIDYLTFECIEYGELFVVKGEPEYNFFADEGGDVAFKFFCPECGELLFEDPEEAEASLRGDGHG